jgi:hypothetical protein
MSKSSTVAILFLSLQLSLPHAQAAISCQDLFLNAGARSEKAMPTNPKSFVRKFFASSDPIEVVRMSLVQYPELAWLTGKVNATPEGKANSDKVQSLSEKIFGEKHIEFDRTATGILLIKWILEGNYDAFTKPQNAAVKMTRENFNELRAYTRSILKTPEDIDAMITYMVINDLGKIKSIVGEIEKRAGIKDVDHDNLLLIALENHPDLSPSFARLSSATQQKMIRGLRPKFNIGQFIQGENLAASLSGLKGLDKESLDFYLLHAVADIGGAAGHVNWEGSVVMSNPTYDGFKLGIKAIEGLAQGRSEVDVYNYFLSEKGRPFGLRVEVPRERALTRLLTMMRVSDTNTASKITAAFDSLPQNTKAILVKEMNINGTGDGYGTLLYYSPALLSNILAYSKANPTILSEHAGIQLGLTTLAQLYQEARVTIKGRNGDGVFTLLISKIAEAGKTPEQLVQKKIEIDLVAKDGEAKLVDRQVIDSAKFTPLNSLSEIPGHRVAVIGIGGGSDGIQAAQLGLLLKNAGKELVYVASVRTEKTASQGVSGRDGEDRTVSQHGGEVVNGTYRILPQTTGSGRFLENLPSDEVPMFLVMDRQNGTLVGQLNSLNQQLRGVDTIITVDTGGDALYPIKASSQLNSAKSTPDQDLRVLSAIGEVPVQNKISTIVAAGIDSPNNASAILGSAGARYFQLSQTQSTQVLQNYTKWDMTGANDARFGKTPLTWQRALTGQLGLQVLPIPSRVVVDGRNPWNPFVHVDQSMAGIFFMNVADHLAAISR